MDRVVFVIFSEPDGQEVLIDVVLETLEGQGQVLMDGRVVDILVVPLVAIGDMGRVEATEGLEHITRRAFNSRSMLEIDRNDDVEDVISVVSPEVGL